MDNEKTYENTCYENAWILNACIHQNTVTQGDVLDHVTRVLYVVDKLAAGLRPTLMEALRGMFPNDVDVYTDMLWEAVEHNKPPAIHALLQDGRVKPYALMVERATYQGYLGAVVALMYYERVRALVNGNEMANMPDTQLTRRMTMFWRQYVHAQSRKAQPDDAESMPKRRMADAISVSSSCFDNAWELENCLHAGSVTKLVVLNNIKDVLRFDSETIETRLRTLFDVYAGENVYTAMLEEACTQSHVTAVDVLLTDGRAQPYVGLVARATAKGQLAVVLALMRDARVRAMVDPMMMVTINVNDPRIRNYWNAYINEREATRRRDERNKAPQAESVTKRNKYLGAPIDFDWAKWFTLYLRTGSRDLNEFLSALSERPKEEINKILNWIQQKPAIIDLMEERFERHIYTIAVTIAIRNGLRRDRVFWKPLMMRASPYPNLRVWLAAAAMNDLDVLRYLFQHDRNAEKQADAFHTLITRNYVNTVDDLLSNEHVLHDALRNIVRTVVNVGTPEMMHTVLQHQNVPVSLGLLISAVRHNAAVGIVEALLNDRRRLPLDDTVLQQLLDSARSDETRDLLRGRMRGAQEPAYKKSVNMELIGAGEDFDWAKWLMRYLRTGPYDLVTFLRGLAKRPRDEVDKVMQWIQTKPKIAEKFNDENANDFVNNLLTQVDIFDFKLIIDFILDKESVREYIETKIHVLTTVLWLRLANTAAAMESMYVDQMRYTLRIMYGEHRQLFNANAVSVLLTAVRSDNAAAIHAIMRDFTLFLPRNDGLIYEAIEADNRAAFDALLEYPTMRVSMNELTRALFRGRVYMMQQLLRRMPLDEKKLLSLIELTADEDMKDVLRNALPGTEPAFKKRDMNACLACATSDATVTCQACGIAQYCGVACAGQHWDDVHQFNCLMI